MGHQLNFFLTPSDASSLVEQLRTLGDLRILYCRSRDTKPKIVDGADYLDEDGKCWGLLLVQSNQLSHVVTEHVPAQQYWSVDVLRSPVIEFSRGFFNNSILREGRLYYVDGFYGADDQWQSKLDDFRAWAESIFAKTRRVLKRHSGWYIGDEAAQWHARGAGKLMTSFGKAVP